MPEDYAVVAEHVGIRYRRYVRKVTTLKAAAIKLFRGSQYEAFWAVRDVSLRIPKGQSVGIIGPNGSGKSTFLKAVAGILTPARGSIRVNGRVAPLIELSGGFNAELTGRENIYLNGAIMGLTRREVDEKIGRIIEFSELGDFIDVPINTYSSGMRARLGFAVATDVDPEVLLLDEVFSVGDERFRQKAQKRMEQFFVSQRTVITVSHSLSQIKELCQRAIYLRHGEVVIDGEPAEVVERYLADTKQQDGAGAQGAALPRGEVLAREVQELAREQERTRQRLLELDEKLGSRRVELAELRGREAPEEPHGAVQSG